MPTDHEAPCTCDPDHTYAHHQWEGHGDEGFTGACVVRGCSCKKFTLAVKGG